MAASSSSSINLQAEENAVFISFSGADVPDGFLSHLQASLERKLLKASVDDTALERGESVAETILQRIEKSYASIIILSENYPNCTWGLDELVKILECRETMGQIVVPVFYHIDPIVVQKLKQNYSLAIHAGNVADDKLEIWKNALIMTSNLTGFFSQDPTYGSEDRLCDEIAKEVRKKLCSLSTSYSQQLKEEEEKKIQAANEAECILLFSSLVIENASAVFGQLDHALLSMVIAVAGFFICIVEIVYKARREKVSLEWRGKLPWLYGHYPEHKLFGTSSEYFVLVAAIWQCFHSCLGYFYACKNLQNPIKMSFTMVLFCSCSIVSKIINKPSTGTLHTERDPESLA